MHLDQTAFKRYSLPLRVPRFPSLSASPTPNNKRPPSISQTFLHYSRGRRPTTRPSLNFQDPLPQFSSPIEKPPHCSLSISTIAIMLSCYPPLSSGAALRISPRVIATHPPPKNHYTPEVNQITAVSRASS
jgi:hypothetical protein